MLQLHDVRKSYTTGDFTQVALDDISISFRDNEFVAVLGPSGSGKTTLLNIVGGLDHADSGSLEIDGVDTSDYRDRDWDTYRNNRVGFVFQSYNLIPHQSVIANVELALTLSGVPREERRQRAMDALHRVGLHEHAQKRPNQLSGGQMQRVAIARALINDPEILLADEPTGALDSTTSTQIMGLLTEIAHDRLVVMVTHNPELAEEYATRIVSLKDGQVEGDTDPFAPAEEAEEAKPTRRTAMAFVTAIALSFNNLMTKKGRTLMTAFAGSIGIIGIAAILALANGVNAYIKTVEEDTLSQYPLTIQSQGLNMASLLSATSDLSEEVEGGGTASATPGQVREVEMMSRFFASVGTNDLESLKTFLDGNGGNIDAYANSVQYTYDVTPQIYKQQDDGSARRVNPDSTLSSLGMGSSQTARSLMPSSFSSSLFKELMDDRSLVDEQYQVMAGDWPTGPNEVVLVLTESGSISDYAFYAMNLRDPEELDAMVDALAEDEPVVTPEGGPLSVSYEEVMDVTFKLVPATDFYVHEDEFDVWTDKRDDEEFVDKLVAGGEDVRISGIVQPKPGASSSALQPGFYYTSGMITHLVSEAASSKIVTDQMADPDVDVFTGRTFAAEAEDPEKTEFDMTSLFEIDEEAITKAFKVDQSKLSLDASMLNMSMPEISIDPSSLPQMDLTDAFNAADFNFDIDVNSIIDQVDLSQVEFGVDGAQATQLATTLAAGYSAYCALGADCTDTAASFQTYLDTPAAQTILADSEPTLVQLQDDLDSVRAEVTKQVSGVVQDEVEKAFTKNSAVLQKQLQSAMAGYMTEAMAAVGSQVQTQISTALQQQIGGAMNNFAANLADAMSIDEEAFKKAFEFNFDEEELTELLMSMAGSAEASYEDNLSRLGYADFASPATIDIYPKDFAAKEMIISLLEDYNADKKAAGEEDQVITYNDLVGTLMSSVTDIINTISYVLVAFVSISLVVSSIMIGVITYISVLERRKEIGVLRSIGASKRDIRRVFNAETLIVGFVAGLFGIVTTVLLTIPTNIIVNANFGIAQVAVLPWQAGLILIGVSMALTFIAGLIPSSAASRRDPVEALRSE